MDFSAFLSRHNADLERRRQIEREQEASPALPAPPPSFEHLKADARDGLALLVHQQVLAHGFGLQGCQRQGVGQNEFCYTHPDSRSFFRVVCVPQGPVTLLVTAREIGNSTNTCVVVLDSSRYPSASDLFDAAKHTDNQPHLARVAEVADQLIGPLATNMLRTTPHPQSQPHPHAQPQPQSLAPAPTAQANEEIREWLGGVDPNNRDRYLRYAEAFEREYAGLDDIALEDDWGAAMDALGVSARGDRRRLVAAAEALKAKSPQDE